MPSPGFLIDGHVGETVEDQLVFNISQCTYLAMQDEWARAKQAFAAAWDKDQEVPANHTWEWSNKSQTTTPSAHQSIGIERDREIQGLMLLDTRPRLSKRMAQDHKEVLYIEYLEGAP